MMVREPMEVMVTVEEVDGEGPQDSHYQGQGYGGGGCGGGWLICDYGMPGVILMEIN